MNNTKHTFKRGDVAMLVQNGYLTTPDLDIGDLVVVSDCFFINADRLYVQHIDKDQDYSITTIVDASQLEYLGKLGD